MTCLSSQSSQSMLRGICGPVDVGEIQNGRLPVLQCLDSPVGPLAPFMQSLERAFQIQVMNK